MKRTILLLLGLLVLGFPASAPAETANLTVNTDKVVKQVDVKIYGQFLEHIYHSLHGGLWGEIVWNRSFEEGLPRPAGGRRGAPPPPAPTPAPGETVFRHWSLVGNATVTADTQNPRNSAQSAKIVADGAGVGIQQRNFYLRSNDTCWGYLWMRGDAPDGITIRFMDGDKLVAEQTLPAPGPDWREYPVILSPQMSTKTGTLQILTKGKATLWLDQVSLMPDTSRANGGFRPDLFEAVRAIQPATLRWPGGSFVGTSGGYNWKTAIGHQADRVGKVGWDELDPSAFGPDEFLRLCKMTGAEPIIVVYLGSRTPGADHAKEIQDACDFIEYCNGAEDSKWGAVRAANGHREPYGVKYWEIDNEIWSMQPDDYVRVVKDFVAAMKKVDPKIITIACGSGGIGAPTSRFTDGDNAIIAQADDVVNFLSIHHYENADRFAEGVGAMEQYLQKLGGLIDQSKNPAFKIYVSEWNLRTSTDWRTGLYAGGILNAFERNKYVTMACPALFLRHTSAPNWDNAFINFDQSTWFPAPNYVVMKLWRDHFAPNLLESSGAPAALNIVATKSEDGRSVVVKLVNPTDQPVDVNLSLQGGFAPTGAVFHLVAPDDLMAKNTLEKKDFVREVEGKINQNDRSATFTMPRWSAGVVELSR